MPRKAFVSGTFDLLHSGHVAFLTEASSHGELYVSVDELALTAAKVAGKRITLRHVDGPVGVHSRNFSNARIYSLGWTAKVDLEAGLALTYPWIASQVKAARAASR